MAAKRHFTELDLAAQRPVEAAKPPDQSLWQRGKKRACALFPERCESVEYGLCPVGSASSSGSLEGA